MKTDFEIQFDFTDYSPGWWIVSTAFAIKIKQEKAIKIISDLKFNLKINFDKSLLIYDSVGNVPT